MHAINIRTAHHSYMDYIGENLLYSAGEIISSKKQYKKAAVVTDSTVNKLYGDRLKKSLEKEGIKTDFIVIKPGEDTKSVKYVDDIVHKLLEKKYSREDLIIAFGGGVIGDLAGFVSSIYLRGLDLVQIPTTLLAQVDSSVGGKVGINLEEGKNLIGAFKHPVLIITDTTLLSTIDDRVYRDGMGEVIKYGCIDSLSVFEKLEETKDRFEVKENINDIVTICVSIKAKYIENDENDKGIRNTLNFGHTIAHAIERYYKYEKYLHGEAVAIGMYQLTRISEKFGYTKTGTAERLKNLLIKYDLPFNDENLKLDDLREGFEFDKKNDSGSIKIVLLKTIGESYFEVLNLNRLDFSKIN